MNHIPLPKRCKACGKWRLSQISPEFQGHIRNGNCVVWDSNGIKYQSILSTFNSDVWSLRVGTTTAWRKHYWLLELSKEWIFVSSIYCVSFQMLQLLVFILTITIDWIKGITLMESKGLFLCNLSWHQCAVRGLYMSMNIIAIADLHTQEWFDYVTWIIGRLDVYHYCYTVWGICLAWAPKLCRGEGGL